MVSTKTSKPDQPKAKAAAKAEKEVVPTEAEECCDTCFAPHQSRGCYVLNGIYAVGRTVDKSTFRCTDYLGF